MPPALGGASPPVSFPPRAAAVQLSNRAPKCVTPRKQGLHATSSSDSGAAPSSQMLPLRPAAASHSTAAATFSLSGLDISAQHQYDSPCDTPTLGAISNATGGPPCQRTDPTTPSSTLRHARSMEHNRLLADRYAELEDLWVESGQAALTPVRNRPHIPQLAIPLVSAAPLSQEADCLTPGTRNGFSLGQTPLSGRGRSAQSQIPSPAPAKGAIGGGFNPVHSRQTHNFSPRVAAAPAAVVRQEALSKPAAAAAASLSLHMSQLHLAVPSASTVSGGIRTSVSPSSSLSPILAKPIATRGMAKEAVSIMTQQHQLRSGSKPSARSALHFSMECESVSSLIVKSTAQGAAQAAKTALVVTPGRSSGRIAARSAVANSAKPTTPGKSPAPTRQQQPQPSTSKTSSTNNDTAPAASFGSRADEVSSPALSQRQQSSKATATRFNVEPAADWMVVKTGAPVRKGRQSTPGPGKKTNHPYAIPISPVSSPPPSPPHITSAVSRLSPKLGSLSGRGATSSHQQQRISTDALAQAVPHHAQQPPSFGPRPSRPPTPHSAASGRGEPMDIDDEAEDDSSSPYHASNQTQISLRNTLGHMLSSSQSTAPPSGTPPVTPPPAFMRSRPAAPDGGGCPATTTPPSYTTGAGGVGSLTPNNTTSLWCDVPATPGGRRMSPGTSQLLSLAFGSEYAPHNMG